MDTVGHSFSYHGVSMAIILYGEAFIQEQQTVMFKQEIIGDTLTLEESQRWEGEYVANWRNLRVAYVAKCKDGYEVTECHPDQESTYTPYKVRSLGEAWMRIKGYCLGEFDNELRELNGQHRGWHR